MIQPAGDTQNAKILAWLQSGRTLTPLESLEHFQCFRLAARIEELKRDGHAIKTKMVRQGRKEIAQYSIGAING